MTPTPEQDAIYKAVAEGHNCMIEALAGCGKTTTIVEALRHAPTAGQSLMIAFNKKIADELTRRTKDLGVPVTIKTMNGLGHAAIRKALRRNPILDNDKIFTLSKEAGLKRQDLSDCMALVRSARMAGLVPKGIAGRSLIPDTPETWNELSLDLDIDPILATPARDILLKSCQLAMSGTIDYDDQIYISTLLFGSYERYDLVFVDEAQDLSPLNHLQVKNAAKTQIVAVGDSHQAIYAWRGADSNSMRNLRGLRETWTDLTLSVTFRCPRSVVARQQAFVPLFTAGPHNLQGHIERLASWRPAGGTDTAVLCRNNAPLIKLAFRCLRAQVPVNYLGKDIGANLKRLYNKLSNHGKASLDTTIANAWAEAKQNPDKLDKYESLVAVLESSESIDSAMRFLTEARTNSITLATGHKAKGMEWPTVYHLNTYLIPSKWVAAQRPEADSFTDMSDENQTAWDRYNAALQQENNLRYVIETRTKDRLLFVDSNNLELRQ